MNQRQLKQNIKNGRIDNLYVFCSDDYFLKTVYARRIAQAKGFRIEKVKVGTEEEFMEMRIKILSGSLFSSVKGKVIYCDLMIPLDRTTPLFKPKRNILIIDPIKCKYRPDATVEFEKPSASEVFDFISFRCKEEKKSMESKAIQLTVKLFQNKDTTYINNTLETIFDFTKDRNLITEDDVLSCVDSTLKFTPDQLSSLIRKKGFKEIGNRIDEFLKEMPAALFVYVFSTEIIKAYASCTCSQECFKEIFRGHYASYRDICLSVGETKLKELIRYMYDIDKVIKSSSDDNIDVLIKTKILLWMATL